MAEALANMKAICAIGDDVTAQQYLDAANGSLEDAINNYMAAAGDAPQAAAAAAPVRPSGGSGGMAGMGSVTAVDKDDEGRQEYYAGGASSGAAILDPKKKETDIFKRLQEAAEAQGPEAPNPDGSDPMAAREDPSQYKEGGHDWGSGGYSLGGEGKDSGQIGGGPHQAAHGSPAAAAKKPITRLVITRYSDGFTLDEGEGEGELRRPDVPENAIFLQDLERGQVPMELRDRVKNGNLDVALNDKKDEPAPPPKFKAFAGGGGNSLGNAAAEDAKAAIAAAASAAPLTSWEGANESQPTTKLQSECPTRSLATSRFPGMNFQGISNDRERSLEHSAPPSSCRNLLHNLLVDST